MSSGPTRLVIGGIFCLIGFFFVRTFVHLNESGLQLAAYFGAVVVGGAIGVYLIPFLTNFLAVLTANISKRVAAEVSSQLRLPSIPRQFPRREKENGQKWINPICVDTSALIDGRIAEIVESGFLFGTIVVPNFILLELQHIADSADDLKRGRGRRGLEIMEMIKKSRYVKTVVYSAPGEGLKNIDERLLKLAKNLHAKILTTDFNLNKVATVSGVKILNVNELVNGIKTPFLPGEEIEVKVVSEGKEKEQGVAYMPDGTMIVVERGAGYVGKKIKVVVSRVFQTVAGRMIFVQIPEQVTSHK
ncbi:MAG: hypothetical protein Q8P13_01100 [bacterium]|nr:hypothetical protein [bacterium]